MAKEWLIHRPFPTSQCLTEHHYNSTLCLGIWVGWPRLSGILSWAVTINVCNRERNFLFLSHLSGISLCDTLPPPTACHWHPNVNILSDCDNTVWMTLDGKRNEQTNVWQMSIPFNYIVSDEQNLLTKSCPHIKATNLPVECSIVSFIICYSIGVIHFVNGPAGRRLESDSRVAFVVSACTAVWAMTNHVRQRRHICTARKFKCCFPTRYATVDAVDYYHYLHCCCFHRTIADDM